MSTETPLRRAMRTLALASVAALALGASGANAQRPPGGGPPPGAPGQPGPLPPPPLSPAEKIVAELAAPIMPGMRPVPPVTADSAMPTVDPRDLQGTWYHNQPMEFRVQRDMYGVRVPYNMEGAKVLARRVNSMSKGTPFTNASGKCRPPGPQWQLDLNMPFQIFQSKDWIEFVFEEYHARWNVILDPAKAPPPADKNYMGYSVGRWDGNTLVIETSDFRQVLWLDVDGTPLSANGKLIQRIRKVDNGDRAPFLEIMTTIVDPSYYARPWSVVRTFGWNPRLTVFAEYNCEEQVGDPSLDPDAGLLAEPKD